MIRSLAMRACAALVSMCFLHVAFAGDSGPPSDIAVSMTASRTTGLLPGQPIDLVLVVTNNGPYDMPLVVVSTGFLVDEVQWLAIDCPTLTIIADGTVSGYFLEWYVADTILGSAPPLLAGESRTCHMRLAITDRTPTQYAFSFGFVFPNLADPVPQNNTAVIAFERAALPPVAAPSLRMAGVVALILLMMMLGAGWMSNGRPKVSTRR